MFTKLRILVILLSIFPTMALARAEADRVRLGGTPAFCEQGKSSAKNRATEKSKTGAEDLLDDLPLSHAGREPRCEGRPRRRRSGEWLAPLWRRRT